MKRLLALLLGVFLALVLNYVYEYFNPYRKIEMR